MDYLTLVMFYLKFFFLRLYLFIFREMGRGGERGRETLICERNTDRLPLAGAQPRDLACNPGMCHDWELNQRPFGSKSTSECIEPHQPGQCSILTTMDE